MSGAEGTGEVDVALGIARFLHGLGVRTAFGMPGGDSLPLIRGLTAVGIRFVLVRDEASAGFAADATAQLTGRPGVCISTLGPGLTNLASGVAGCTLDRAPVLAFTSRYSTDRHGTYTHMMLDQTKILDGTGKAWLRLTAANAAGELRRAAAIAMAPRPGAVWVEVPTEVAAASFWGPTDLLPPPSPVGGLIAPPVLERIAAWKRPVVLVGTAWGGADIAALAQRLRAPVLTSYKAKGSIPEATGWSAGAAGLSRPADRCHQALIGEADGLLLIGWDPVELRDHWLPGWSDTPEVVVVDAAAPTDLPCRVDAMHVGPVPEAVASVRGGASLWSVDDVAAHRATWMPLFDEAVFGPASAVRAVQAAVDACHAYDPVVTLDVGAHRITASHVWRADSPNRLLQSNGWSSMGYGIPAALAACAAGHAGVAIIGDMGLQLMLGELGTAAELGGTLVVVVMMDASLSLIELKQERLRHPTAGVRFANPDIALLASAFGGVGVVVDGAEPLADSVVSALSRGGLSIVGVTIDPSPYRTQM